MSPAEIDAFLAVPQVVSIASHNRDGSIHLVAMRYVMREGEPCFWTYAKSRKIQNLERNPALTLLADAGEDYAELRGVQLVGQAEIIRDRAAVVSIGSAISHFYRTGGADASNAAQIERAATKRVAVRLKVTRTASWDHRKLGHPASS